VMPDVRSRRTPHAMAALARINASGLRIPTATVVRTINNRALIATDLRRRESTHHSIAAGAK
jgi:hypothetical protein